LGGRKEDHEFEASLDYIERLCLYKKERKERREARDVDQ
jgi:hypothetical protein